MDDVLVASAVGLAYRAPLRGGSQWSSDYSPEARIYLAHCLGELPAELSSDLVRADILALNASAESWLRALPPCGERFEDGSIQDLDLSCCEKALYDDALRLRARNPGAVPLFFRDRMDYFLRAYEKHPQRAESNVLGSLHALSSAMCLVVHRVETPEYFSD